MSNTENHHLDQLLDELKLTTVKKNYRSFSKEAISFNESMVMYLTRLMEEEYNNRIDNRIKRLITQSKFPSIKHLSEFQFSQSEIKKQQILEICLCCLKVSPTKSLGT